MTRLPEDPVACPDCDLLQRIPALPPWGVVAENLVSMLGTSQVSVFPQTSAAGADYRVAVDVLRFDSAPGGAATLDALWTIRSAKPEQARSGRTSVTESAQGGGYNALVAAHSRALGKMSTDIAGTIREMQARPK